MARTRTLTVWCTDAQIAMLDSLARRHKTTRAGFVRQLINVGLKELRASEKPS